MKLLFITITLFLFLTTILWGQNSSLLWVNQGKAHSDRSCIVKINTLFNLPYFYSYGSFIENFHWQNFDEIAISKNPNLREDGWISKMDVQNGNLIWFSHFGDTAKPGRFNGSGNYLFDGGCVVNDIDLADPMNPAAIGTFYALSLFGSDTLHSIRNNTNLTSFFRCSYNAQGNFTSLKKEGVMSMGLDIARDRNLNTYAWFFYYDTSWVNGQRLPIMNFPDNGIYLLKYSRNNQLLWKLPVSATQGGGFSLQIGNQNHLYFGGQLGRRISDPKPNPQWKIGNKIIPNTEQMVGFVAKADSNGNVLWTKTITGPGDATVINLILDSNDNTYVTGYYTQSATFATGVTLNSMGDKDIFLAKYDKNGTLLWAKSMGGIGTDNGLCLAMDETTNSLYLSGDFYNTATFAPGKTVTSAGENDVFVAWYSLDGTFQKVIRMGGTSYDNLGWCTVPRSGELLVSGNFSNTADFLGTTLQAQAPPDFQGRKQNFFIAKLKWDGPLAFESLKLTARPCYNGQSYLSWQAVGSSAPCTFYVERSPDGKTWEDLHSTCLQDRQREGILYYTDLLPPPGTVFYRIRYESADSEDINYSNIIQTRCREADYSLSVYPNPADDKIYIRSSSSVIRWFDPLGQELFPKQDIDGGWMVSAFSSGIYLTYVDNRCFKWVKR